MIRPFQFKRLFTLLFLFALMAYGAQDFKDVQILFLNAWSDTSVTAFLNVADNNLCALPGNRLDIAILHLDEVKDHPYTQLNKVIADLGNKAYSCGAASHKLQLHVRVFFGLHTIHTVDLIRRSQQFFHEVMSNPANAVLSGVYFHLAPILEDRDAYIGVMTGKNVDAYPGLVQTMFGQIPDAYSCKSGYIGLIRSHIPKAGELAGNVPGTVSVKLDCDAKPGKETTKNFSVQHEIHGGSVNTSKYEAWSNDGILVYHPTYESPTGTSDAAGGGSSAIPLQTFDKAMTSHLHQVVTLIHRPRYNLQLYKTTIKGKVACVGALPKDGKLVSYCASANSKDADYRGSVQDRIDVTTGAIFDELEGCVLMRFLQGETDVKKLACSGVGL